MRLTVGDEWRLVQLRTTVEQNDASQLRQREPGSLEDTKVGHVASSVAFVKLAAHVQLAFAACPCCRRVESGTSTARTAALQLQETIRAQLLFMAEHGKGLGNNVPMQSLEER